MREQRCEELYCDLQAGDCISQWNCCVQVMFGGQESNVMWLPASICVDVGNPVCATGPVCVRAALDRVVPIVSAARR